MNIILLLALVYLSYQIYCYVYFKSNKFLLIKESIKVHTKNCNDLNQHIKELKNSYDDFKSYDCVEGKLEDESNFNFKRKKWNNIPNNRVHNCSSSICKNAKDQPFKYLCKYFNIKINEETLINFENTLNNFAAAEQGKILLKNERDYTIST